MGQKWAWNKPFDWTEKLNVSNVDQINFSRLTMDYICEKIKAGHNGALLGQISQLWCKTAQTWTWAHLLNGRTYLRTQKSEDLIGCVKTRPKLHRNARRNSETWFTGRAYQTETTQNEDASAVRILPRRLWEINSARLLTETERLAFILSLTMHLGRLDT